ncbi:MAG: 50S ribosomal protein L5 [Proteobacteria bacterium]|nr:50S ribosomal protein L5 [Pseudomonadota bacterium]
MTRARLQERYFKEIRDKLRVDFGYRNIAAVPFLEKIVVSMGLKDAISDSKIISHAMNDLWLITGQKPIATNAKKSIANFKLRKGMPIGCKVTLRKKIMYEFLDRFIHIALPRMRDFRGFSKKQFDGNGNFSAGFVEQTLFPEIDYDKIDKVRGFNVVIVTSASTNQESMKLLEHFNMPFA